MREYTVKEIEDCIRKRKGYVPKMNETFLLNTDRDSARKFCGMIIESAGKDYVRKAKSVYKYMREINYPDYQKGLNLHEMYLKLYEQSVKANKQDIQIDLYKKDKNRYQKSINKYMKKIEKLEASFSNLNHQMVMYPKMMDDPNNIDKLDAYKEEIAELHEKILEYKTYISICEEKMAYIFSHKETPLSHIEETIYRDLSYIEDLYKFFMGDWFISITDADNISGSYFINVMDKKAKEMSMRSKSKKASKKAKSK